MGTILRVLQRSECANTHFPQTIFQIGFTEIYVPFVCRTEARTQAACLINRTHSRF